MGEAAGEKQHMLPPTHNKDNREAVQSLSTCRLALFIIKNRANIKLSQLTADLSRFFQSFVLPCNILLQKCDKESSRLLRIGAKLLV